MSALERRDERPVVAWAEDDKEYRALVREWLEPRYRLREYEDSEALLADLERAAPDAVMADVDLPGMDGFTLCEAIRARGYSTPLLLLTSSADQEDQLRQVEVDAAAYLTKPVGRRQLLARLAEIIDGERVISGPPSGRHGGYAAWAEAS